MKLYSQCTRKQAARELFLPHYEGGEYWTMCGPNDGPGSEYDQAGVEPGLFHGVDIDLATIELNRKEYPETNWYCGDFYEILVEFAESPGLINMDSIWEPPLAAEYASRLMTLRPRVLVMNTVLKSPRRRKLWTPDEVLDCLFKYPAFRYAMENGHLAGCADYAGTGDNSRTIMGTFIFHLTNHNL